MKGFRTLCTLLLLCITCFIARPATAEEIRTMRIEDSIYYVICDTHGTMLHEPVPYEIQSAFSIYDHTNGVYVGEAYGFVNHDGHFLAITLEESGYFSGFIFTDVFSYSESLMVIADLHGNYGYIDLKGNVIIPCQWEWAQPFENGIALVTYRTADGYANVWINKNGEIVSLDPEYGYALQEAE